MLQGIPEKLGRAMAGMRSGGERLVCADPEFATVPQTIQLISPAFEGGWIPVRYTEDGEKLSPPLEWVGVPPEAESLVLLIEDQDSPTPKPLVHAILADMKAADGALAEGALPSPDHAGEGHEMGRNSFLRRAWLPPDPPPGHGEHRYVFQLFALDHVPSFDSVPGRGALVAALKGHVIDMGVLVARYARP